MKELLSRAWYYVSQQEPAMAIGAVAAVATEAHQVLAEESVTDWKAAAFVLVAYLIRRKVYAPANVEPVHGNE